MDTEIARLLAALDPDIRENTYVIFMGDNGTANRTISAPFHRGENSVYEGGVNVPLIVTGPGVERNAVSDALVNSTDMFYTIMEMAGVDPEETVPEGITTDSVSFFRLSLIRAVPLDVNGFTLTRLGGMTAGPISRIMRYVVHGTNF